MCIIVDATRRPSTRITPLPIARLQKQQPAKPKQQSTSPGRFKAIIGSSKKLISMLHKNRHNKDNPPQRPSTSTDCAPVISTMRMTLNRRDTRAAPRSLQSKHHLWIEVSESSESSSSGSYRWLALLHMKIRDKHGFDIDRLFQT